MKIKPQGIIVMLVITSAIVTYLVAGKQESKAQSTSTVTAPIEQTSASISEKVEKVDPPKEKVVKPETVTASTKPSGNKISEEEVEGEEEDPLTWPEGEDKDIYLILQPQVLAMFASHDTVHAKANMFSRCPSGYNYYVEDTVSQGSVRYGKIVLYSGCDGDDVCDFRLDLVTKRVELRELKAKEFVSVQEFERQRFGAKV